MKMLLLACLLCLAAPATASSATMFSRELPLGATRTLVSSATPERPFELVGLHWQGTGSVLFRTRSVRGVWSAWHAADADSGPDLQSPEARSGRRWHLGSAVWTGASNRIQWRAANGVRRLRAYFIRSLPVLVPMRRVSLAGSPQVMPRAGWLADDEILRGPPSYAPALRLAIVHHTATTNSYSPAQSAAIVRGIELYHVRANGWSDIGYNFLVDRYGQIFEGRYGGMTRNVIGAHAQGFNTGSVGIAVIGNFTRSSLPRAAQRALTKLIAWRLDLAHVDPLSMLTFTSYGNPRFPAGRAIVLRAVSGHRDTGYTDCPGNGVYSKLPQIAAQAEELGLPKLYAPTVVGKIGRTVRFSARLSQPLPWTIAVVRAGQVVARASGFGTLVAWRWSSVGSPPGRYTWTMDAGANVRPASGIVGNPQTAPPPAKAPPLVRGLAVTPALISPNGDGYADAGLISYVLRAAASVTVQISDETGATVAVVVPRQPQASGLHSLSYAPDALPDGRYTLTVAAQTASGQSFSAQARFVVDRILASVAAQPPVFSPNGDGIDDTIAFSFALAGPATVTVEVQQAGTVVTIPFQGTLGAGDYAVTWNGQTPSGLALPGSYELVVKAVDALGESSQNASFELSGG